MIVYQKSNDDDESSSKSSSNKECSGASRSSLPSNNKSNNIKSNHSQNNGVRNGCKSVRHQRPNKNLIQTTLNGFEIDRSEYVRLLTQSLLDLGYEDSARNLEKESGIYQENQKMEDIEQDILKGQWENALEKLKLILSNNSSEKLLNRCKCLFYQEKYFELLDESNLDQALICLRQDLQPLCTTETIEFLSSLLLCSNGTEFRTKMGRAKCDERIGIIQVLRDLLPESLVLPKKRLLTLLDYSMQHQIHQNGVSKSGSVPLIKDLSECENEKVNSNLPSKTIQILTDHEKGSQIWCVKFNHTGSMLASAGTDKAIYVYSLVQDHKNKINQKRHDNDDDIDEVLTLSHYFANYHQNSILWIKWSPNDKYFLSGDVDGAMFLTDCTQKESRKIGNHKSRVTCVSWINDSQRFFTSSFDNTIHLYNIKGDLLAHWCGTTCFALEYSSKHNLLIASCSGRKMLRVFTLKHGKRNFVKIKEVTSQFMKENQSAFETSQRVTSMVVTNDESTLITNFLNDKIIEWDMLTGLPTKSYGGINQGKAVVCSSIGGFQNGLLACGGIDARICIWERASNKSLDSDTGGSVPIKYLHGHKQSVNAVSFSSQDPSLLVSASDDGTLRVWSNE